MLSVGGQAVYIIISFLILWSICLSSSLVYFKNGPDYLTRGTVQVFIFLMRFLFSRSFPVRLRYFFLFYFLFRLFDSVNF